MKIVLEYRRPTPSHCDVVVFINGANAGTLTLRQSEVVGFQQVISHGLSLPGDFFQASGDPGVQASQELLAADFPGEKL